MHSELVVLGGGPGGYAAAFLAADEGMEVTIVEAESKLGGTCLLRGCIPSKALLHVARVISEVDELRADWGVTYDAPKIDIDKVRARKEKVITTLSGGLGQLAKRRNVRVIQAKGVFENSTTLRLEGDHESIPAERQLTFGHCVLATGSVPAMPPNFMIGSDRVMDSTGALNLVDIPKSLLDRWWRLHRLGDGVGLCQPRFESDRRGVARWSADGRRSRSSQTAAKAPRSAV